MHRFVSRGVYCSIAQCDAPDGVPDRDGGKHSRTPGTCSSRAVRLRFTRDRTPGQCDLIRSRWNGLASHQARPSPAPARNTAKAARTEPRSDCLLSPPQLSRRTSHAPPTAPLAHSRAMDAGKKAPPSARCTLSESGVVATVDHVPDERRPTPRARAHSRPFPTVIILRQKQVLRIEPAHRRHSIPVVHVQVSIAQGAASALAQISHDPVDMDRREPADLAQVALCQR